MWDPTHNKYYYFNRRTHQHTWDEPEGFRQSFSDQLLARDNEIALVLKLQKIYRAKVVRTAWSGMIQQLREETKQREMAAERTAAQAALEARRKKRRMTPSQVCDADEVVGGDGDGDGIDSDLTFVPCSRCHFERPLCFGIDRFLCLYFVFVCVCVTACRTSCRQRHR